MDKNAKDLDKTIDEPKESYCRDVTFILNKNATDHSITLKVTEQLEYERLKIEHAHIDKKIAETLKRIEKSQQESQELDRKIYKATQIKNQAMNRFKTTGDMINVLKEEGENIKNHTKNIQIRQQGITKKVEELTAQGIQNELLKKKIEHLESNIRKVMDEPEPKLNEKLVQKNIELKKKLEQRKNLFKIQRTKQSFKKQLKDKKIKILQEINEKQERNRVLKEKVTKKKGLMKEREQKLEEDFNNMQKSLNKDTEKRNALLEQIEKSVQNAKETQKKIKETQQNVADKEETLEHLKQKIETRQMHVKEENDRKGKEYEYELAKLRLAEQKLQEALNENKNYMNEILMKSDQVTDIKEKTSELIVKLCHKKNILVVQQHQNAEQQNKIDALMEKEEAKKSHVDQLRNKNDDLEKKLKEVQIELQELPVELEEKRQKMANDHKEKMDGLLKQNNFQKATIEFIQLRLDDNLKNIEDLQNEVKEYEEGIKWFEMKYEMRNKTNLKIEEKLAKEKAALEKLEAQLKQKEDEKKIQNQKIERNEIFPVVVKNKSPAKERQSSEEIEIIEEEDKMSTSSKSPGILKSPHKEPKSPVQINKRVTFEGLSSTESSSLSLKSDNTPKTLEDESIDELLNDWAGKSYYSSTGNRRIDF